MRSLEAQWLTVTALVGAFVACGSGNETPDGGGGDGGADTSTSWDGSVPPPPPATCVEPVKLVDTSTPTTVVGAGDPSSCTELALSDAVKKGGIITFNCGASPATITVTSKLLPPVDKDTIIDGAGKVTLSGGGTTRILSLEHSFEKAAPTLTVQRLTLTKARTTDVSNTGETKMGGAAIYTLGGNVTAIDCMFLDNHGPDTGQDVAGGAIYNVGAGSTIVQGCVLSGNTCSNGGALGALGANLTIVNSTLSDNATTGMGGNPGNGGNGGGAVMDGKGKTLTICGATFSKNKANAFGGAIFRTSYENEPTNIDKTSFDGNEVPDQSPAQAGAVYLQGTKITMTNASLTNNSARFAGAMSVYEHGTPAPGVIDMTNVTIANNKAWPQSDFTKTGLVGGITVGDRVTGTWVNVTIVGNSAQFAAGIGGASTRLTIKNSILHNAASNEWVPINCNGASANGSDDLQWPQNNKAGNDLSCVTGIQRADPKMGALELAKGLWTMKPMTGSPAFGLGKACPSTDQLGNARKSDGCTLGAIE